jgi:hypothetical protein
MTVPQGPGVRAAPDAAGPPRGPLKRNLHAQFADASRASEHLREMTSSDDSQLLRLLWIVSVSLVALIVVIFAIARKRPPPPLTGDR